MTRSFVVNRYDIDCHNVDCKGGSVRIILLCDLHDISYGDDNKYLIKAIDGAKPDVVMSAGDLLLGNKNVSFHNTKKLLGDLAGRYPVYCSDGNHESKLHYFEDCDYMGRSLYARYREEINTAGVYLLENSSKTIRIGSVNLAVHGYNVPQNYYARFRYRKLAKEDLQQALGNPVEGAYNILLAHNPRFVNAYLDWGTDLVLSGHYHGGLLHMKRGRGLISPQGSILPKYSYGHFDRGSQHVVVSSGLGDHTMTLRFNNPRELVVVNLNFN